MQANKWAGRIPRITSAMSPRLIYFAVGLGVLGVLAVIYGFHYRIQKKEQMKAGATSQVMATDAATSNRLAVHGEPVPGSTPAANLGGTPAAPAPASPSLGSKLAATYGGAVRNVAAPYGRPQQAAWNCPPLPTGQPDPSCQAPPAYPSYATQPAPEIDASVRMKSEREQRAYSLRLAALDAPTSQQSQAASAPSASLNPVDQIQADLARISALSRTPGTSPVATTAAPIPGPVGRSETDDDPNQQGSKRAFQQAPEGDYLKTTRMAPISPWVVERGEVIPAGLPSQIVSDLPGDLVAEVKRDVYDTPTHRYVLIPAGSLLGGEYNSAVSYGQKRVQVVWSYLRFPDGSYVDLDKFVGHAADGSTGLSDQVDNHIKRLIGGVALSSLFAAGLQISQNRTGGNSTLTYPSNAQLAASAVGQQAADGATDHEPESERTADSEDPAWRSLLRLGHEVDHFPGTVQSTGERPMIPMRPQSAGRRGSKKRKYHHTPETDAAIVHAYHMWNDFANRRAIPNAAAKLGWPRYVVVQRARLLGLSKTKEKPWTAAEEELLEQVGWMSLGRIALKLKAAGFVRTETAIRQKMKRLQVKATLDGYTMRQLAQLFGCDDHKVSMWIKSGALAAECSGVACGSNEKYFIKREVVRRFILHHPEEVDITRCEKYWLLDIVSNGKLCEEFRREVA